MEFNHIDANDLHQIMPHRYPFKMVDKVLDYDSRKRIVAIKNISVNDPYLSGHFPDNPVMPGSLLLESLAQTGLALLLQDSEFFGRFPFFKNISKCSFNEPVVPGDQVRIEVEIDKIKDNDVAFKGYALVDGKVVCEALFSFSLNHVPSSPQIHPTASVHPTAILGKDVTIGPNSIVGEHVEIGDNSILEANTFVEKWTRIGDDCHIHFGCVIGSAAQDIKYKGEKSYVVIGDRNQIREYVTINRPTGKDTTTEIGSDNLFLTNVHIAHNCKVGNRVIIANMTNIGGHSIVEDACVIGGMTGIHQFVRIGRNSMVGAYTRLPQDVPPFMLCEGNPAVIRGINSVGLRRNNISRDAIKEIREIHRML